MTDWKFTDPEMDNMPSGKSSSSGYLSFSRKTASRKGPRSPSESYPLLYVLSSRFVIARAGFVVGIPTTSRAYWASGHGDGGGIDAPPCTAGNSKFSITDGLYCNSEATDLLIGPIRTFPRVDRRVGRRGVDNTLTLLAGEGALRTTATTGGVGMSRWTGAMTIPLRRDRVFTPGGGAAAVVLDGIVFSKTSTNRRGGSNMVTDSCFLLVRTHI